MPYKDPEERRRYHREYMAKWYEANKEAHKETVKRSRAKAVELAQRRVDQIKARPCADCDGFFDPVCMDFDHNGSEKLGNVSTLVLQGWSWKRIEAEIAKCEIVCANCHRLRTKRGWRKGISAAS